jgi:hypothetical protein
MAVFSVGLDFDVEVYSWAEDGCIDIMDKSSITRKVKIGKKDERWPFAVLTPTISP